MVQLSFELFVGGFLFELVPVRGQLRLDFPPQFLDLLRLGRLFVVHLGQLIILENEGNRILKENDAFDEVFDVQLRKDFVPALGDMFVKGRLQTRPESPQNREQ